MKSNLQSSCRSYLYCSATLIFLRLFEISRSIAVLSLWILVNVSIKQSWHPPKLLPAIEFEGLALIIVVFVYFLPVHSPSSMNSSSSLQTVELLHRWLIEDWWFYFPVVIDYSFSFERCLAPLTSEDWEREWCPELLCPFLKFKKTLISSIVRGDYPIFLTFEPLLPSFIVLCLGTYCLKLSHAPPP